MVIIDIFTHVLPKPVFERLERHGFGSLGSRVRATTQLHDFDARFRVMDEYDGYRQVISLSGPPFEEVLPAAEATALARIANDAMAELVARHPDRFPGFVAALGVHDVEGALAELERAVDSLGACGVQLYTDHGGRPIDEPAFDPVFAAMAARGLPIWLHPSRPPGLPDYASEDESAFDMWQSLGWPYATSVAMIRLILTGLFDRHAGVRIITHHLGGMIPYHPVRVERALLRESRRRSESGPEARTVPLSGAPLDYLRMFYGDTAMSGAAEAVKCGLGFFGPNKVVFATDHPFNRIHSGVDMIERLGLDEPARRKIVADNAIRLCRGRLKL